MLSVHMLSHIVLHIGITTFSYHGYGQNLQVILRLWDIVAK